MIEFRASKKFQPDKLASILSPAFVGIAVLLLKICDQVCQIVPNLEIALFCEMNVQGVIIRRVKDRFNICNHHIR